MKKRLISLALVLVLAMSLFPAAALAVSYDDFTDLKDNVWYTPAISFVLEKGYFIGMSDTEFAPSGTMTRAMFVTVIARMDGAEIDNSVQSSFNDVKANAWYTGSIEWAAANGIVKGYEDGSFRPNNHVTRQEMAAIMARYIDWSSARSGSTPAPGDGETVFADQEEVDKSWAANAIKTCVAYGLLKGYPDGSFGGKRNSTRAEVAAVIERLEMIVQGEDHIYKAVLNVAKDIETVVNTTLVKEEDLSAEYKDYITSIGGTVGDISISGGLNTSIEVGAENEGSRIVSVTGNSALNQRTAYDLIKTVAGYAVVLFSQTDRLAFSDVKEIVAAVYDLSPSLISDSEIAEITELIYSAVRDKSSDIWTGNFKGPKGYYTGDITVKVGSYSGLIPVNQETGVSLPNWKAEAKTFAMAAAVEVINSITAQAKDYTDSIKDIGAVIDITFSAGAYKKSTDRYAYNYPVDISFTFENEFDGIQYKMGDIIYLKAFVSKEDQEELKGSVGEIMGKFMESDAFMEEFSPAVEEVKNGKFAPVIELLSKGEKQDEDSAGKLIEGYISNWAKDNAAAKLTGDGQWDNGAIYDLVSFIGLEVCSYVEKELSSRGLALKSDVTPAQLKKNMEKANIEFEVPLALENYVLAVICDQVSGEDNYAAEDGEVYAAMKGYVDTEIPATLESNESFNKALEMAEEVRSTLESVEKLSAVDFGNFSTVLRNEIIQSYLADDQPDNPVIRIAEYIKKVPANTRIVFAGCTLSETDVARLRNAGSMAELCNTLADIIDESGIGKLTLAHFAPAGGQNITVSYGSASATVNLVIELEK